jgi:threonine synthase
MRLHSPCAVVSNNLKRSRLREGAVAAASWGTPAGGVAVGVAQKLIALGKISLNDSVLLCVTGNGLKKLDAVAGHVDKPREIKPSLREFEALLAHEEKVNA